MKWTVPQLYGRTEGTVRVTENNTVNVTQIYGRWKCRSSKNYCKHIVSTHLCYCAFTYIFGGLLYTSRHKFRFFEKYYFQNFGDYFCAFWIFRSFPGFFSTCFEISVWNLVYTCSRWCYTSSSSFIPIETLWPTLQPKIGQSHLSAFMALKII